MSTAPGRSQPTRLRGKPEQKTLTTLERVTLFVCAMHKADAQALFELFADRPRAQATEFAKAVLALDSATRQARLTREFGARADALERLKALVVEAPGPLRSAIVEQLPPAQRALFPHLGPSAKPTPPAMRALAARLVREASRAGDGASRG